MYRAYDKVQHKTAGIIPITRKLKGIDIKPRKYERNTLNHKLFSLMNKYYHQNRKKGLIDLGSTLNSGGKSKSTKLIKIHAQVQYDIHCVRYQLHHHLI